MFLSHNLFVLLSYFTPLVFTTTGGMAKECSRYQARLAELLETKKGEDYASTMSWIRTKLSFAIVRSALLVSEAHERLEKLTTTYIT